MENNDAYYFEVLNGCHRDMRIGMGSPRRGTKHTN
jgi:hypothetical protein